ncbi:MAG TPA: hypothetical protein VIN08_24270 [Ohtaekwangia sp.]|uniref:hypothetical protein n=1 Tax=Ohtaekwangia sp. TaxID=2066019 RepID=UPI002F927A68
MKKLTVLSLLVLLLASSAVLANDGKISILSKKRDIFYFKVSNEFIGATVQVYSEDGQLLMTEKITHHKALIDFYYEKAGEYKIKIVKDSAEQNFNFTKAGNKDEATAEANYYVTLNQ